MPLIPDTTIAFEASLNLQGKKNGKFWVRIKDKYGSEVLGVEGASKEDALAKLIQIISQMVETGKKLPYLLRYGGHTMLLYPASYGQWSYDELTEKTIHVHGGSYSSQQEAVVDPV